MLIHHIKRKVDKFNATNSFIPSVMKICCVFIPIPLCWGRYCCVELFIRIECTFSAEYFLCLEDRGLAPFSIILLNYNKLIHVIKIYSPCNKIICNFFRWIVQIHGNCLILSWGSAIKEYNLVIWRYVKESSHVILSFLLYLNKDLRSMGHLKSASTTASNIKELVMGLLKSLNGELTWTSWEVVGSIVFWL